MKNLNIGENILILSEKIFDNTLQRLSKPCLIGSKTSVCTRIQKVEIQPESQPEFLIIILIMRQRGKRRCGKLGKGAKCASSGCLW